MTAWHKEYYQKHKKEILQKDKEYYQKNKEKILQQRKEYRQKNKDKINAWHKAFYQKNKDAILQQSKDYYKNNVDKMRLRNHKFLKTAAGKKISLRHYNKRKRNLGFIQMFPNSFANSVEIEWHHITDCYVVAVPRELHRQYLGKYHREKTMSIVKQIYLGVN